MADFAASRRLVDGRALVEPIIAAIAIGHNDALLDERGDADVERGTLQAPSATDTQVRIGGEGAGCGEVAGNAGSRVNDRLATFHHRSEAGFHAGGEQITFHDLDIE